MSITSRIPKERFREFISRFIRAPLRMIPPTAVLPILTGSIKGSKWIVGSAVHACWLGLYESDKQALIAGCVDPGGVAYDIGAHVGFYSLLFSKLVGEKGEVIAFEPLPRNLAYLERHLKLNRVSNVRVIPEAVSIRKGVALFQQAASSTMGKLRDSGDLEVRTTVIDDLVSSGAIPGPQYVKMDVEGGEVQALAGMRATLEQFRPHIFLATHGFVVRDECLDFLRMLGYSTRILSTDPRKETGEVFASHEKK